MTAQANPGRRQPAMIFIFVTVLLDMIGFGLITPVLPALIEEVGHVGVGGGAAVAGWMFFAFAIAQFVFGPVMGNLSDAYGRRPLLLLAVGGLALDYVLAALAPTLFWLFVGRVIAGICGASYVIANAYIADVTAPEDRARAFGMMGAAFGVGFVIGPAIGGLLGEFGPRVPFWVAAGLAGLNFLFGLFILPESLPRDRRRPFDIRRANPFGAFKVFRTYGNVLPLCAVVTVFFFATSVYPAIWPFWGIARFGWSEAVIGATLAAFGIVAAITQGALSGPLVKRFGEYRVAFVGLIFAALVAAGYGVAWSLPVVIVLIFLHAPEGLVHPMLVAILSKSVPDNAQGELQGGLSSLTNLAMLCGTVFFSQLFALTLDPARPEATAGTAFLVSAAVLAVAFGLFVAVNRRRLATN